MKIDFSPEFTGPQVEIQIGDQSFLFKREDAPFEVAEPIGAYCLRLPQFVASQVEAPAVDVAESQSEVAPRKK